MTGKSYTKMVPPDGGWGWLVVLGSSIMNVSTVSIGPSFGLLFGGLLKQLGVETTGASFVMSTMDGIANLTGLIVGPLIKKYSYRKVSILGAALCTTAFLSTAPANSMLHILITYALIGGTGFGLANSSTLIVINEYFTKKKGQAIALSMTGTVVGFMLMPQVVRFLLDEYDFRSALLIIGGISLHAVAGACLFQPVSWHKKTVTVEEEEAHTLISTDKKDNPASTDTANRVGSNVSWPSSVERNNLLDIPSKNSPKKESLIQHFDGAGNTLYIQGITDEESGKELAKLTDNSNGEETQKNKPRKHTKSLKSRLSRFYNFMDLNLLRDGVYLNILYSQAMLLVVESNFKLILPFFLSDLGFTHSETASVLSSMAVSDICSRIIVPPILDRVAVSRRATFILGSVFVALCRSSLALQSTLGQIIVTLVITGFIRGISVTSFPLVLAEYSSGKNFASVLGLSMVSRGISIVILGPLSGYIRDVTKSYPLFIHCQTVLMISVLIAWIVEIVILKSRKNKQASIDALDRETEDEITVTKA